MDFHRGLFPKYLLDQNASYYVQYCQINEAKIND